MKRHVRLLLATVGLVGVVALGAAAPAFADGTTQVDGIQRIADLGDPFDPADDVFTMEGYGDGRAALIGLWYTRSFELGVATPSGVVTGTGTEEFVGCLDADGNGSCGGSEPAGTLRFSFEFSGKFDPVTFAQQHGRCHHPITGGTGDFESTTGVLVFKDDPDAGCSYYAGHLTLG